jgi:hypothetical protein
MKQYILSLLERGSCFVHFRPGDPGVSVPPQLRLDKTCCFQFGLNLHNPILDLEVTDTYIAGTLSIDQRPYPCFISFTAVWEIHDDDGHGRRYADAPSSAARMPAPPRTSPPRRGHLRLVK